ncbi:ATP-binding protein [Streptosporangium amethystogenes]|uniref:ATP-binding protein n=1 Tax=Streptosporangium amethystogenes TaxID=2002 RepID=UPI0004CB7747|nr:ATP-binding protein [Streptosporangium amethystogenes]
MRVGSGPGPARSGSTFPREKSLRAFDFDANPDIDPAVIHTLAKCEWVQKGQPLCLIGDSGTGKSHLLIALGTVADMARRLKEVAGEQRGKLHLSDYRSRHVKIRSIISAPPSRTGRTCSR